MLSGAWAAFAASIGSLLLLALKLWSSKADRERSIARALSTIEAKETEEAMARLDADGSHRM